MSVIRKNELCTRFCSNSMWTAAIVALVLSSATAAAQTEIDADFQAYCRVKYANSFHQRIGLTHYCQQASSTQGATRHNIDLAEACRMTTGNDSFRRMGSRIICAGAPSGANEQEAETTAGPPDFQAYCRERFPNSSYERRAERWGVVHYCRRPGPTGGFTLQPIDLAEACLASYGSRTYRRNGPTVACIKGRENDTKTAQRRRDNVEPMPNRAEPHPPERAEPEVSRQPAGAEGAPDNSDGDLVEKLCRSFGGQWRSGTIPLVEEIISQWQDVMRRRSADCIPPPTAGRTWPPPGRDYWIEYCQKQVASEETQAAFFKTAIIWQCHAALFAEPANRDLDDLRTAQKEGCNIQEKLYNIWDKNVEANNAFERFAGNPPRPLDYYDPWDPRLMLERWGISNWCDCRITSASDGDTREELQNRIAALDSLQQAAVEVANGALGSLFGADRQSCQADRTFLDDQMTVIPIALIKSEEYSRPKFYKFLRNAPNNNGLIKNRYPWIELAQREGPSPDITSPKGPFPAEDFTKHQGATSVFRGHAPIHKIQDEMTRNAGRDQVLQDHSWQDFERYIVTAKKALEKAATADNDSELNDALSHAKFAYDDMKETHRALIDRRLKLMELQKELDAEFASETVQNFLKQLNERVSRNRQFELEFGKTAVSLASWAKKILDRLAGEVGKNPYLSLINEIRCIIVDLSNLLDTLEEDRIISRHGPYFMDLMSMQSSVERLLAQYEQRITAESELIEEVEGLIFDLKGRCVE